MRSSHERARLFGLRVELSELRPLVQSRLRQARPLLFRRRRRLLIAQSYVEWRASLGAHVFDCRPGLELNQDEAAALFHFEDSQIGDDQIHDAFPGVGEGVLWTLPAGSYTVILGANNGGTGSGLVELYDMGGAAPIVNLSSRAYVGTGDNVLIGGVYVQDGTRAVIRAIGPTLANYGIQGALADPVLELYDAQGTQIASNDNWGTDGAAGEIGQLGLAPPATSSQRSFPLSSPGPIR